MQVDEAQRLSELLRDLPRVSDDANIKIDTFHHPYVQTKDQFAHPEIDVTDIRADQAHRIIENLKQHVPAFISGCSVLPLPRPIRDSHQLHFARRYDFEDRKYIYIFKVSAEYMGGAKPEELKSTIRQGISPAIMTNRIYFHARLIPVSHIEEQSGYVTDFKAIKMKEALMQVPVANEESQVRRERWTVALFDQVDFSELDRDLSDLFSFGAEWKCARLFSPFCVDYLSVTAQLVNPEAALVDRCAPHFDRVFSNFLRYRHVDEVHDSTKKFWRAYYQSWAFHLDPAPSGNPHWRFTQYPTSAILKGEHT